jgi:hypothetical protein
VRGGDALKTSENGFGRYYNAVKGVRGRRRERQALLERKRPAASTKMQMMLRETDKQKNEFIGLSEPFLRNQKRYFHSGLKTELDRSELDTKGSDDRIDAIPVAAAPRKCSVPKPVQI